MILFALAKGKTLEEALFEIKGYNTLKLSNIHIDAIKKNFL